MQSTATQTYPLAKVASILKLSRPLVLKMARSGEIPCERTPLGLRVDPGKLEAWIEAQRVVPFVEVAPQNK
jgi:hypothetical protein